MTDQVENGGETAGPPASVPQFPMPESAIKKAAQEGRPVALMPVTQFEKPKRPPALYVGRMRPAEAGYNRWIVEVENDTARESILSPMFWAHVAGKLQPRDHIEVYDERTSFKLELIVRSKDKMQAVVAELSYTEIKSPVAAETIAAAYTIKHRGNRYKYSVLDTNGNVVVEGLGTQEEAEGWIAQRAKAMAA